MTASRQKEIRRGRVSLKGNGGVIVSRRGLSPQTIQFTFQPAPGICSDKISRSAY